MWQLDHEEHDPLLPFGPSEAHTESRVDMTAMVDLVFMLNIFFLVTSTFAMLGEIDLPQARHVVAADLDESVLFTLLVVPGSDEAALYQGDGTKGVELSGANRDEQVAEAVESGLRERKTSVVIKAARDVRMRDVGRVATAAAVSDEVKISLAVTEVD